MNQEAPAKRLAFDPMANDYDKFRPSYPAELVRDVMTRAHINASSNILEVGCGTGKATQAFAPSGARITACDPGNKLIEVASRNLSKFKNIEWIVGDFEKAPIPDRKFDLIYCAQSYHWLEPVTAVSKFAQLLKPKGWVALFWNSLTPADVDFREELIRAGMPNWTPESIRISMVEKSKEEVDSLVGTGVFEMKFERTYRWHWNQDADQFIALLKTYTDVANMEEEPRAALLDRIRAIVDRRGGHLDAPYEAVLFMAQKK